MDLVERWFVGMAATGFVAMVLNLLALEMI
jgi:hypothetical protein